MAQKILLKYLESKVTCFKAGRLRYYHDEWTYLTSNTEILQMVTGQKLEFSQTPLSIIRSKRAP